MQGDQGSSSSISAQIFQQNQKARWPSGLRRRFKAPFRNGVGSNPTLVTLLFFSFFFFLISNSMAPRAQLPEEKPRATSKWKPKRKPKNCENVTTLPCQTALRSRPVVSARDRPSSGGCHSPRDTNATKPLPQARTPSNSRLKNKKIKNKKVLIAGPLRYRARSPLLASSIARAKERERERESFSESLAVLGEYYFSFKVGAKTSQ